MPFGDRKCLFLRNNVTVVALVGGVRIIAARAARDHIYGVAVIRLGRIARLVVKADLYRARNGIVLGHDAATVRGLNYRIHRRRELYLTLVGLMLKAQTAHEPAAASGNF